MESNPAIRLIRHTALYALILMAIPAHSADLTVVRVGGCSGVVVEGGARHYVLTANHCGLTGTVNVLFADDRPVPVGEVIYRTSTHEGCTAIRLPIGDYPARRVAFQPPAFGDKVWGVGVPGYTGKYRYRVGKVIGSGEYGGVPIQWVSFWSNLGQSGGPLVNEAGEVVGVLSIRNPPNTIGTADPPNGRSGFVSHEVVETALHEAIRITEETQQKPVMHIFTTPGCVPCQNLKTQIPRLEQQYVVKVHDYGTPEGRAAFSKLVNYRSPTGQRVQFRGTDGRAAQPAFPCVYIEGKGAALVGFVGWDNLMVFVRAVLRLPRTLVELVFGPLEPERGGDQGIYEPVPDPLFNGGGADPGITPFRQEEPERAEPEKPAEPPEPDFEGVTVIMATDGLITDSRIKQQLAVKAAEEIVGRIIGRVSKGKARFEVISSALRPTAYTDLDFALPLTTFEPLQLVVLVPQTSQGFIKGLVIKRIEDAVTDRLPEVTAKVVVVFEREEPKSYMGALRAVTVEEREPEPPEEPDVREEPDRVEQPDAHDHEAEVSEPVAETSWTDRVVDAVGAVTGGGVMAALLWVFQWFRRKREG